MLLRKTLPSNDLSYTDCGSGTPVVLLHGFGENSRIWSELENLSTDCRLLIPDLPGSGASPLVADMSMEGLAHAAVARLLDAEGIGQCVLIGHSMGGYVALAFAEANPERLSGLGLIHSTAFADTEEKKETRRKGMDFIRKQGADLFMRTSTPNLYADGPQKEELVARHLNEATGFTQDAFLSYYEAMIARPDRRQLLKEAKIPILFVLGRHDKAVSLADGLAQCHLPETSQVYLLEEAGHMGMRECPQLAKEHLHAYVRFLNQRTAIQ